MGESYVEEAVGVQLLALPGLELGYCARMGEVDLRLIGSPEVLEEADAIVRSKLATSIFSTASENLETVIVRQLAEQRATLAVAESCTGGYLAHRLTNVPGASSVFLAGYVTYSNEAKISSLGVPADLIAEHGAVSEPVARAMAEGARAQCNAQLRARHDRHRRPGRRERGQAGGHRFPRIGRRWRDERQASLFPDRSRNFQTARERKPRSIFCESGWPRSNVR